MKVHSYFFFANKYYKYPIEFLSSREVNYFKISSFIVKTNGWSDSFPMVVIENFDLCYNEFNYSFFEPIEVSQEDFYTVVFKGF